MTEQTWEQVDAALDGGDGQAIAGDVSGQGAEPGNDAGYPSDNVPVSGETVEESVEQVIERVLAEKLGSLRQDLGGEIERRVQSFSDKAVHRLSEAQQQRLQMLDQTLEGLQDALGPDFEQVKRQKQLDILLDTGAKENGQATRDPGAGAPQTGPVQVQSMGFEQAYLMDKLGDPSGWTPEARQAIQSELSNANGYSAWMAVVERYAQQRPGAGTGRGPGVANVGGQGVGAGGQAARVPSSRAARAQPVQRGSPAGTMSAQQLQAAFNAAAASGNFPEMERLGVLIDKMVMPYGNAIRRV